ncbi:Serine/Threonine protein kinase [Brazilian cedratvirus IHUMI]|uniref:Serine/Threonine protein kinase n=1 Tax=Brazilian cedratvirus IHUMI TaxID=2126980 RepID=A0A2R8FD81_9VIRU|nr:Serine/Threonine protein kinase [Brazilian cedratvirus IHUMI]
MLESYKIGETLGKGSYGEVKLAERDGVKYAIKKFNADFYQGVETPVEIAVTLQASHPNIIQGKEYFTQEVTISEKEGEEKIVEHEQYLVMELADTNLYEYIKFKKPGERDRVRLFYELTSALAYLQDNGFYHCDIKPVNILIKDNHVKLGDLGVAGYKSLRGSVCNTYFSPQDYSKNNFLFTAEEVEIPQEYQDIFERPVNFQASDIWALGITFIFILTGKVLFYEEDTLPALFSYLEDPRDYLRTQVEIPPVWMDLIEHMLQPRQEDRPHLAKEILQYPEFVQRSLSTPIPGSAPIFYNLDITVTPDPKLKILLNWLEEVVQEYEGNSTGLSATAGCLYYVFDDLTDKGRNVKILQCLGCACLLLMGKIYDVNFVTPEDLVYMSANIFTTEQLYEQERRVMDKLQGRLYFNNLATLAFSKAAWEKSREIMFDPALYASTNLVDYMKKLELTESIEERNNRQRFY